MSAPVVLVTGGSGLLGQALVRELRAGRVLGPPGELRLFDRVQPAASAPDARWLEGDVCDPEALGEACRGVDLVIHAASRVDFGHTPASELERVNVGGTRSVIEACRKQGVRGLVYTSTMDVLCDGRPVRDADERTPYPSRFQDAYARTKAEAEQLALAADDPAGLRTSVVRPCGLFGEADPYHVSNVLRLAREGRLAARMGSGRAVFQHCYVGNAAHLHLLAGASLLSPSPRAAGEVYLATDEPAANFFDFMEPLVVRLGHPFPPRRRRVPFPVVFAAAVLLEGAAALLRPWRRLEPTLTRSSVRVVCQDLSFRGEKARRELGYEPPYTPEEARDRTVAWFAEHGPIEPA